MEVHECIRTRRTIREFKPDPVPEEVAYKILQAAR
jgi:nitroreductase